MEVSMYITITSAWNQILKHFFPIFTPPTAKIFSALINGSPPWKGERVVSGFSGRWSIEDTFKNTKQLLGGQQIQCFKRQGPERAAEMSFALYSLTGLI